MTLVVVGSVAGSPGATSLAIGLAAAWPDAGRRRVVVEADPDGGRLGAELGVGVEPGLMALALAARTATADGGRSRRARRRGRRRLVRHPGAGIVRAGALGARPRRRLAGRGDGRRSTGPVWIVDAGRLSTRSPSLPFAVAADHVVVVTAGSFPALQLVPHRVEALRNAGCAVSVVVVEPTSWPTDEIAQFVGADVVAVLPRWPRAATGLRRCGPAPGGRGGIGSSRPLPTSTVVGEPVSSHRSSREVTP